MKFGFIVSSIRVSRDFPDFITSVFVDSNEFEGGPNMSKLLGLNLIQVRE